MLDDNFKLRMCIYTESFEVNLQVAEASVYV